MTDKLLPCPHCGEADHLYLAYHGLGTGSPYAVDCLGCGADFTPREGRDVIAAWNRRAPAVPIPIVDKATDARPAGLTNAASYGRLPPGVRCRCVKLWRDDRSDLWCCQGARDGLDTTATQAAIITTLMEKRK